jgi:hypothetical protein
MFAFLTGLFRTAPRWDGPATLPFRPPPCEECARLRQEAATLKKALAFATRELNRYHEAEEEFSRRLPASATGLAIFNPEEL